MKLWQSLEIQGSLEAIAWEGVSEADIWPEIEGSEGAGHEKSWEHHQAREEQKKGSWEVQSSVIRVQKVRGHVWKGRGQDHIGCARPWKHLYWINRAQEDTDVFYERMWDKPTSIFKPTPWDSLENIEWEGGLQ